MWINRCYFDDIPDSAPKKLESTLKVPSYRKIALCILKNDLNFKELGFSQEKSNWAQILLSEKNEKESKQIKLI